MPTFLPLDSDNNPMPALRLRASGGAHAIAASTTSARNTTPFNAETRIVSVYADVPVYLKFGGSSVTAATTDHYFPAGVYYDFAIGSPRTGFNTHLAVRTLSGTGNVYVSEKE
jgi:hypothetical protein